MGSYVEATLAALDSREMVYLGKGRLIVSDKLGEQIDPDHTEAAKRVDRLQVLAMATDQALASLSERNKELTEGGQ